MSGIVRAGVDAARFGLFLAQIARGRLFLDHCLVVSGMFMIVGLRRKGMDVDISIRAIFRAQAAADAPILDDDFE